MLRIAWLGRAVGYLLTGLLLTLSTPASAQACRGWQWETLTLLDRLPQDAEREEVVAEVEIVKMLSPIENVDWYFTHLVRARVLHPVKGVAREEELIVNMRDTACDQNMTGKAAGRRYFIAGALRKMENGEIHFTGRWRRDLASGGLVKDSD